MPFEPSLSRFCGVGLDFALAGEALAPPHTALSMDKNGPIDIFLFAVAVI